MNSSATIFALSSGTGLAGVAVVRMSGTSCAMALTGMTGALPAPRSAALRTIRDPVSGEVLDRGLVVWFPGPGSFTGEDCAEFHLHGSRAVVDGVLKALSALPGYRLAEPGEFSLRAFKNGKIDLYQAEALGDLIAAQTAAQRRLALAQADGAASRDIESWRAGLMGLLAHVEAVIDFSDEDAAVREIHASLAQRCDALIRSIDHALGNAARARDLRSGLRIAIAGPPNAGKSSLLNRLAGREAAIVSSRPGTTRDVVEAVLDLGGVPVTLSDTAGLRAGSADEIETEGIARAMAAMESAHAVLWVEAPDARLAPPLEGEARLIRVLNKADRMSQDRDFFSAGGPVAFALSTVTGEGLDALVAAMTDFVRTRTHVEGTVILARARQETAARRARDHLSNALIRPGAPLETIADDLRRAVYEVGRITGRVDVEDLLGAIFSEFCIGK